MRRDFADWAKLRLRESSVFTVLLGDISVGLFVDSDERLPDRCFNIGILEQSMVSLAAGLSKAGFDVLVHTISPFIVERAFEQIKLDICYNKNKVVFVSANSPFEYNKLGPTHHCSNDVPLFSLLVNSFEIRLPVKNKDVSRHLEESFRSVFSSYIRLCGYERADFEFCNIPVNEITCNSNLSGQVYSNSITVLIGEAVYIDSAISCKRSTDYFIVIDKLPLDGEILKSVSRFKDIHVFEPYSLPIVANRVRSLNQGSNVFSHCYPPSMEDGIFNMPTFINMS
jgi:hypothetical protein